MPRRTKTAAPRPQPPMPINVAEDASHRPFRTQARSRFSNFRGGGNRGEAIRLYQQDIRDLEEETVTKGQLYLSFVNRAIAYKFMGKDKEAQNDVNQAVT